MKLIDINSPEEVKASYKAKIKPIKQSIESLPITISTLQSSLPDISGIDISTAFYKFYGVSQPLFIDFAELICEDNYPATER